MEPYHRANTPRNLFLVCSIGTNPTQLSSVK